VVAIAAVLFNFVGTDYFPQVDAGQMTLHVRAPPGTRIEQTEKLFQSVEDTIRDVVPPRQIATIIDNIGLPASNYNFAFGDGTFLAYYDGQILVALKPGHGSTLRYQQRLRAELHNRYPSDLFYFQPADIITQILDFGVPAQVDIQVSGRAQANDLAVANDIVRKLRVVPGAVDVHLQQITNAPEFFVNVDRERAAEMGLTESQIATDMNVSLSGSFQTSPNFWSDPKTGIPYQIWVQTPEYRNDSISAINNTPLLIASAAGQQYPQLLRNVATLTRGSEQTASTHINTQRTYDIYAAAQNRDLGGIEGDIDRIVRGEQTRLQAPDTIRVRGQIQSKNQAFARIGIGLCVALVAVYLLMCVNFQTWGDPLVVLLALPLAFCGIVASLFITQTTFSIPSLMGAIMSIGVASANSILLVTFAREHREEHGSSAMEAAIAAAETRMRPVLMTAGAMFVGLIPMAIGIGEGSEQNAALARAVLGGVAVGTGSTLIFVPFLYTLMRGRDVKKLEDYA
jgi:multidrug efflux pump subunit AcrB